MMGLTCKVSLHMSVTLPLPITHNHGISYMPVPIAHKKVPTLMYMLC